MEINKERIYEVIRKPLITEKGSLLSANNKILFEVSKDSTKEEIKQAAEFLFKIKVDSINTINQNGKIKVFKGKKGKRKNFKKAILTLKEGQNIDLASGI